MVVTECSQPDVSTPLERMPTLAMPKRLAKRSGRGLRDREAAGGAAKDPAAHHVVADRRESVHSRPAEHDTRRPVLDVKQRAPGQTRESAAASTEVGKKRVLETTHVRRCHDQAAAQRGATPRRASAAALAPPGPATPEAGRHSDPETCSPEPHHRCSWSRRARATLGAARRLQRDAVYRSTPPTCGAKWAAKTTTRPGWPAATLARPASLTVAPMPRPPAAAAAPRARRSGRCRAAPNRCRPHRGSAGRPRPCRRTAAWRNSGSPTGPPRASAARCPPGRCASCRPQGECRPAGETMSRSLKMSMIATAFSQMRMKYHSETLDSKLQ